MTFAKSAGVAIPLQPAHLKRGSSESFPLGEFRLWGWLLAVGIRRVHVYSEDFSKLSPVWKTIHVAKRAPLAVALDMLLLLMFINMVGGFVYSSRSDAERDVGIIAFHVLSLVVTVLGICSIPSLLWCVNSPCVDDVLVMLETMDPKVYDRWKTKRDRIMGRRFALVFVPTIVLFIGEPIWRTVEAVSGGQTVFAYWATTGLSGLRVWWVYLLQIALVQLSWYIGLLSGHLVTLVYHAIKVMYDETEVAELLLVQHYETVEGQTRAQKLHHEQLHARASATLMQHQHQHQHHHQHQHEVEGAAELQPATSHGLDAVGGPGERTGMVRNGSFTSGLSFAAADSQSASSLPRSVSRPLVVGQRADATGSVFNVHRAGAINAMRRRQSFLEADSSQVSGQWDSSSAPTQAGGASARQSLTVAEESAAALGDEDAYAMASLDFAWARRTSVFGAQPMGFESALPEDGIAAVEEGGGERGDGPLGGKAPDNAATACSRRASRLSQASVDGGAMAAVAQWACCNPGAPSRSASAEFFDRSEAAAGLTLQEYDELAAEEIDDVMAARGLYASLESLGRTRTHRPARAVGRLWGACAGLCCRGGAKVHAAGSTTGVRTDTADVALFAGAAISDGDGTVAAEASSSDGLYGSGDMDGNVVVGYGSSGQPIVASEQSLSRKCEFRPMLLFLLLRVHEICKHAFRQSLFGCLAIALCLISSLSTPLALPMVESFFFTMALVAFVQTFPSLLRHQNVMHRIIVRLLTANIPQSDVSRGQRARWASSLSLKDTGDEASRISTESGGSSAQGSGAAGVAAALRGSHVDTVAVSAGTSARSSEPAFSGLTRPGPSGGELMAHYSLHGQRIRLSLTSSSSSFNSLQDMLPAAVGAVRISEVDAVAEENDVAELRLEDVDDMDGGEGLSGCGTSSAVAPNVAWGEQSGSGAPPSDGDADGDKPGRGGSRASTLEVPAAPSALRKLSAGARQAMSAVGDGAKAVAGRVTTRGATLATNVQIAAVVPHVRVRGKVAWGALKAWLDDGVAFRHVIVLFTQATVLCCVTLLYVVVLGSGNNWVFAVASPGLPAASSSPASTWTASMAPGGTVATPTASALALNASLLPATAGPAAREQGADGGVTHQWSGTALLLFLDIGLLVMMHAAVMLCTMSTFKALSARFAWVFMAVGMVAILVFRIFLNRFSTEGGWSAYMGPLLLMTVWSSLLVAIHRFTSFRRAWILAIPLFSTLWALQLYAVVALPWLITESSDVALVAFRVFVHPTLQVGGEILLLTCAFRVKNLSPGGFHPLFNLYETIMSFVGRLMLFGTESTLVTIAMGICSVLIEVLLRCTSVARIKLMSRILRTKGDLTYKHLQFHAMVMDSQLQIDLFSLVVVLPVLNFMSERLGPCLTFSQVSAADDEVGKVDIATMLVLLMCEIVGAFWSTHVLFEQGVPLRAAYVQRPRGSLVGAAFIALLLIHVAVYIYAFDSSGKRICERDAFVLA